MKQLLFSESIRKVSIIQAHIRHEQKLLNYGITYYILHRQHCNFIITINITYYNY